MAVFLFLIAGFWILQIRDHEANSTLAERNRIKTVPLLAPRGKILDRDGRVIVDNQPAFVVQLTQENLKPEHLAPIAEGLHLDLDDLKATVKRYAAGKRYSPIPIKRDLTPAELDLHRFAPRPGHVPGTGSGAGAAPPVSAERPGGACDRIRRRSQRSRN